MTERCDPSCWVAIICGIDRDGKLFPRGRNGMASRSIPKLWQFCIRGTCYPASVWAWYWVGASGSVHHEHCMTDGGAQIGDACINANYTRTDEIVDVVMELRNTWLAAYWSARGAQEQEV